MKNLLIVQPYGVFNTRDDLAKDILIRSEKVNLLSDILNTGSIALCIYHNTKADPNREKIFWSRMLKMMGIKYGVYQYFTSDSDSSKFFRSKKPKRFCIVTSTASFSGNAGMVITNQEYGLQQTDVQKIMGILTNANT